MGVDDPDIPAAPPGMDPVLLARMTGRLGDSRTIQRKASDLASAMCAPLETVLDEAAGLKVVIERDAVALGMRREFEAADGAEMVRCSAALSGWCADFSLTTTQTLAVAFVESLLGGNQSDASDRPLTSVERDISILFFERVLSVFRETAGATQAKATAGVPQMATPDEEDERPDVHSVRISLKVTFDGHSAPLAILLPQTAVMKLEVAPAMRASQEPVDTPPQWAERLSRQVSRSDVRLRAHVRLEPLTLDTISRLQAGDVLTFADTGEVSVQLEANGRAFGTCELGRSGARYMLRLTSGESFEDELARDLTP